MLPLDFGFPNTPTAQRWTFGRRFQLLDLAFDLFRGLAEDLFLQLGDAQPQGLDQLVVGAQGSRYLRVFRLQRRAQRLQNAS